MNFLSKVFYSRLLILNFLLLLQLLPSLLRQIVFQVYFGHPHRSFIDFTGVIQPQNQSALSLVHLDRDLH